MGKLDLLYHKLQSFDDKATFTEVSFTKLQLEHICHDLTMLKDGMKDIMAGDVGRPGKADTCPHGQYGYENCEACYQDYAEHVLYNIAVG